MISKRGLDLIKGFESLALEAYPDPGTGGEPWTIGYGHTGGVKEGDTCTEEDATDWLQEDCREAEACIAAYVHLILTQNQHDALTSFVFNCGCGNFKSSTLCRLVNAGDFAAAVQQFARWNKGGGRILAGLTRRRAAEAALFMET
jgi:lysozyme